MSTTSLLPDNRTTLETALEKTLASYLAKIDSPYPNLWNPATVSPELLPYLAHAKGVSDWGDDTEAAKRDTVANIWPVQGKAGTRAAVKEAVDSLGFDAEVKRGDGAYQLQVDLWRTEIDTLEPDIVGRVARRVELVKSERDEYALTLNVASSGQCGVGLAMGGGIDLCAGLVVPEYPAQTQHGLLMLETVEHTLSTHCVVPDPVSVGPLSFAASCQSVVDLASPVIVSEPVSQMNMNFSAAMVVITDLAITECYGC